METLIGELARVGAVKLRVWGPRNPLKRCFEAVGHMTQCHSQWRSCIGNSSFSAYLFNLLFCCRFFSIPRPLFCTFVQSKVGYDSPRSRLCPDQLETLRKMFAEI